MKSLNDNLKSVHPPDDRNIRESKIADKGNPEEKIGEEDKFKKLVQISRHLAHQLNNLLTTILANTQLMLLVAKDEELKPYLKALENAARSAGAMVRDFQGSIKALAGLSSQEDEAQPPNKD